MRMEWRPARWSVCLPLLIFPCTIKSRRSLLAPSHPGGPGKKGRKTVVAKTVVVLQCLGSDHLDCCCLNESSVILRGVVVP